MKLNHILLLRILLAFPHGLPDHGFMLQFVFFLHHRRTMNPPFHPPSVFPSANLSSFHLPHTETRQWGPPPFILFSRTFCPPWGTHFTLGHLFLYLYIFPKLFHYFLYKHLYFTVIYLCRHRWRPSFLLATRNPCHPWLEHYFPFSPVGIVYIFRTLPRSLTLYPLNLLTLSRLWHNLPQILSSP